MFGSAILDVAIGLILIYLLCSLICTALREAVELCLKSRAIQLERGIRALLEDPKGNGLTTALYNHPVVSALYEGKYNEGAQVRTLGRSKLPSYIPARNFALAMLDIVVRGKDPNQSSSLETYKKIDCKNVRENLNSLQNPQVQRVLLMALDVAQDDIQSVQAQLEAWYESAMDRVAGWYKKQSQWIVLALGMVVAVTANVNSTRIAQYLARNSAAREALVAQAGAIAKDSTIQNANFERVNAEIARLGVPVGWSEGWNSLRAIPSKSYADTNLAPADILGVVIGWLATALAISLGAPFWFDLLNKVTTVRSTIKSDDRRYADTAAQLPAQLSAREVERKLGFNGPTIVRSSGTTTVNTGDGSELEPHFKPHTWTQGDPEEGVL